MFKCTCIPFSFQAPLDGTTFQSVEDCRLQLEHSLENTPQISTGKKRFRVPNKHLQGLNAKVNPVRGHPQAATEWYVEDKNINHTNYKRIHNLTGTIPKTTS